MTFNTYPTTIDEAALTMYFATLLMDDATKRYVQIAKQGLLWVYAPNRKSKCMEPIDTEPICISNQPEAYQDILREIKGILEKQMEKIISRKSIKTG